MLLILAWVAGRGSHRRFGVARCAIVSFGAFAIRGRLSRTLGLAAVLAGAMGCGLETRGTGTGTGTGTDELSPGGSAGTGGHGGIGGIGGAAGASGAGGVAGGGEGGNGPSFPDGFEPVEVNVPDGFLCEIPGDYIALGGDPVRVPCAVEADRFSDRDLHDVPSEFRVVTWNVQFGINSSEILLQLKTHPKLSQADFILLQSVPRIDRASDPDLLNQTRQLAEALQMDYAFAVEWDRRLDSDGGGEVGSAVLSKYPLGNVTQIRHAPQHDWWGELHHYGGIMTLAVDAAVGLRRVRFYSSHLDVRWTAEGRAMQAAEIRSEANLPGQSPFQVVAGNWNTVLCNTSAADCTKAPSAEPAVRDFLAAGWSDGTLGYTGHSQIEGILPQRLDYIFYRHMLARPGSAALDSKGADHFPLYFDFALDL